MRTNTRIAQTTDASCISKDTTSEISKVAVSVIGVSTCLIGVWAVACIIAGISNSAGPIVLLSDLFKTISG